MQKNNEHYFKNIAKIKNKFKGSFYLSGKKAA
jgi:hypothetical protein